MLEEKDGYIIITEQGQLDELTGRIKRGDALAKQFKFPEREMFVALLESLEIDYDEFEKTYFYFDGSRNLHIGESEFKYVWISTHGLIAKSKVTTNRAVNACINQYTTVSLLMDKALEVSQNEKVYDVDSHHFGYLSKLAPALFHNILFYIEVLCKAYLALCRVEVERTHKLSSIYELTVATMKARNHTDSLFQIRILEPLCNFINHVNSLPENFREQFVKYDDNPHDDTVVIFRPRDIAEVMVVFQLSNDFIYQFYYEGEDNGYLKQGALEQMLALAKTEEEKVKILNMYAHLANKGT